MTTSREDTEKMLNHDGGVGSNVGTVMPATATLGRHGQIVVVGPPTVSISAANVAPSYIPNTQWTNEMFASRGHGPTGSVPVAVIISCYRLFNK